MNRLKNLKLLLIKKQAMSIRDLDKIDLAVELTGALTTGGLAGYALHTQHKDNARIKRMAKAMRTIANSSHYSKQNRHKRKHR